MAGGGPGPGGTVHLGGTLEEIARSEAAVTAGRHPDRPFVLLAQQSLFDPTRAPAGRHGVGVLPCPERFHGRHDRADPRPDRALRAGLPRADPGKFDDQPGEFEAYNPNYVGGDIAGGRFDLGQLFRGFRVFDPYATPDPRIFLCSAATPPGGGVHGMAGWHAARSALRRLG